MSLEGAVAVGDDLIRWQQKHIAELEAALDATRKEVGALREALRAMASMATPLLRQIELAACKAMSK